MTAPRLSPSLLDSLPTEICRPRYDRSQPAGVVHIGLGAFHRAHQAAYFDALMSLGETGWMIRGASLRSPAVAAQLAPQGGLYTLCVRDGARESFQIVGAVRDVIVAPGDPGALVTALAHPDVALVTITVTEKGYPIDPATGGLLDDDPGVRADLADPQRPRTLPGFLAAGLAERRRLGLAPLTVLSCDNLPGNGERTRRITVDFSRRFGGGGLADWIERRVAFPSSMVDRIVPATTPEDIAALEAKLGYRDEGLVATEPFSQWVVEDSFAGRRPPLERVGVQITRDVAGWERAKLRLLNGAHSALAYLGALAGCEHVHEAIAAPGFLAFVERLWDESQTTLGPVDGFDPAAYRAALLARFRNAALMHRTRQIAMDGSLKLPQRLVAPLRERLAQGLESPALLLAIAGWMRWQYGVDERGAPCAVDDPMAGKTRAIVAAAGGEPEAAARALLGVEAIFGDLGSGILVVNFFSSTLRSLLRLGAARAVAELGPGGGD